MKRHDALVIIEDFGLLYALVSEPLWYIQLPNGLTNLKEIEEYVARYIKSGLPPVHKEPWQF